MLILDEADVMIDQFAGQATDSLEIKKYVVWLSSVSFYLSLSLLSSVSFFLVPVFLTRVFSANFRAPFKSCCSLPLSPTAWRNSRLSSLRCDCDPIHSRIF